MTATKCPLCGKLTTPEYRPFCSRRCSDVDLQRWLVGRYVIPATDDEDGPAEEDPEA